MEFRAADLKISEISGDFSIYQTQRNQAKKELIEALNLDLAEMASEIKGAEALMTADGPTLSFEHEGVQDQLYVKDREAICSGRISITFNAVFRNLSYDTELEAMQFEQEEAEKASKLAEKEKLKKAKIKRDAESRAEKARAKEEMKENIMKKLQ